MPITKTISAPIGAGILSFVAKAAAEHVERTGGRVVVVSALKEIGKLMLSRVPDGAQLYSSHVWFGLWSHAACATQDGPAAANDLVLVLAHNAHILNRVMRSLTDCPAEVWLVDPPLVPLEFGSVN